MTRLFRALGTLGYALPKHRFSSAIQSTPSSVQAIICEHGQLDVEEFRKQAFDPARPVLITKSTDVAIDPSRSSSIPAVSKWFTGAPLQELDGTSVNSRRTIQWSYLEQYKDTIVPYELLKPQIDPLDGHDIVEEFRVTLQTTGHDDLASYIPRDMNLLRNHDGRLLARGSDTKWKQRFYTFYAPLALFLQVAQHASTSNRSDAFSPRLPHLYIAQAQIRDLPLPLQEDLPTPSLVKNAGRGDIYDANIWLGTPPTYTPLHKDPNPNLFVQLASSKVVRLFRPEVGLSIFHTVRSRLRGHASPSFRGEEMMQGPERTALDEAVWHNPQVTEGFEVTVRSGDAIFIPKGWWHSIKSLGRDVTASANWWFR